jgi:hypothetical protein
VNGSEDSAALLDLSPVVLNIGTQTSPLFVIEPSVQAISVPGNELIADMTHQGARVSLTGKSWFAQVEEAITHNIIITSASLSQSSLNIVVSNTSNKPVKLGVVIVSLHGLGIGMPGGKGLQRPPGDLPGIAIFVILPDGTLQSVSSLVLSEPTGYELGIGKQVTLTYSGPILLGFGVDPETAGLGIVAGQQYQMIVVGEGSFASVDVTSH